MSKIVMIGLVLLLFLSLSFFCKAQVKKVTGLVIDSVSKQSLPNATVIIIGKDSISKNTFEK
jgi:hypothetical protein